MSQSNCFPKKQIRGCTNTASPGRGQGRAKEREGEPAPPLHPYDAARRHYSALCLAPELPPGPSARLRPPACLPAHY